MNPGAAQICDIDVAVSVHRHARGTIELPVSCTEITPQRQESALRVELLHPVITAVHHIDVPVIVNGHVRRLLELSIGSPL